MVGDGLFVCSHPGNRAVPLNLAARHLCRTLTSLSKQPSEAAVQNDGWQLLRVELAVRAPARSVPLLLDWLEAQAGSETRSLFATRDGSLLLAGAGAAHVHHEAVGAPHLHGATGCEVPPEDARAGGVGCSRQEQGVGPLLPVVENHTHERIRYVGGVRFDASDPDGLHSGTEWERFGCYYWILPRLELSVESRPLQRDSSTAESLVSSCASTPARGSKDAETGFVAEAILAVQLRWHGSEAGAWEAERGRAIDALHKMQSCGGGNSLPGAVARKGEQVSQEEFEAGVRQALGDLQDGRLQKVVLARRVSLELAHQVDAVRLLRQVVGHAYKRHYLFMLQPVKGIAFLSLTPERLCRVQGSDIWTEAVAGTWPIEEFDKIGEAALLASSVKNNTEHQLVGTYIHNLLRSVSEHIQVLDTHILKLKNLVHIKKSYHSTAVDMQPRHGTGNHLDGTLGADAGQSVPFHLTDFFCKQMSPTPAVCGLPLDAARRFIRRAEPFDRGLYAAPCGIVSSKGSELIVALRSALMQGNRKLYVYAGAGIVPGSKPAEEFAEISLKMQNFTEGIPAACHGMETSAAWIAHMQAMPNLNTLWAFLVVEECIRAGVRKFVICPGSRSTPLVVAVARHAHSCRAVNHDERGAAFYALGWAKATETPVAVIVTSGTAVANLLPGAVEAAQAQVPLLLLTADRPPELRDTGANQTITQPGIFGVYVRWAKDLPPPSVEYPAHALLSDVDLAVAAATGQLSQNPGPVHLNFCFRENLAPDAGDVRNSPGLTSDWNAKYYVDTPQMHRWVAVNTTWSTYLAVSPCLRNCSVLEELVALASSTTSRVVVLVGALRNATDVLLAEDIALRLRAAVFADITSGLRLRPGVVNYADQLLNSPLLAGDVLQLDAVVHLGGAVCSKRLNAFVKTAAPRLNIQVASGPVRRDEDHVVTHHLACSLQALAEALGELGLDPDTEAPTFWRRLSDAAGDELERLLAPGNGLTEPFVARTVSRKLAMGSYLQISSSMPIRDLDFFAKPSSDPSTSHIHPPVSNRGASGIDGVLSTAAGFCHGKGAPATLIIGDVASLHDLNALQQLAGSEAPPLTVVIVNNAGGGIFSFLPIAQHREVMMPFFTEPHVTDFSAASGAFGVPYTLCETAEAFEASYTQSQGRHSSGACVIEARSSLSHGENVALHKELGKAVERCLQDKLLSQMCLGWLYTAGKETQATPIMLLHGWLGEKADWKEIICRLSEAGQSVLAVDLPGHGRTEVGKGSALDQWQSAALFSLPMAIEALKDLLDALGIKQVVAVGYSLGGRLVMAFRDKYPSYVLGTIVLSAHPGLRSISERQERASADLALAARLASVTTPTDFDAFLEEWYAAPLWGGLVQRRPDLYDRMLSRRRRTSPQDAARLLLGMSLARQKDLWPSSASGLDSGHGRHMWYVYGDLDNKFAAIGEKVRCALSGGAAPGEGLCHSHVIALPGAGHAVVEECPDEIARLCCEVSAHLLREATPQKLQPAGAPLQLTAAWSRPIDLLLKAPLLLSRGDAMPRRSGVLIILEAQVGDGSFAGVGEVSPLPNFHKESVAEAQSQLQVIFKAWTSRPPTVPLELARLDGSMRKWLQRNCPGNQKLLPSVQAGLEMALLHLLARSQGMPHLGAAVAEVKQTSCSSDVCISALLTREEELQERPDGPTVVKIKVGGDPVKDAERTNRLAELLRHQRGPAARLRLDANQAWVVDQAVAFVRGLSDFTIPLIEYWEEPLKSNGPADNLVAQWEMFSERTQSQVQLAVDESLTEGKVRLEDLEACKAHIAALVLKPTLQGLEQTVELAAWALERGARPVLSSAFESGVALCHFAILAASTAPPLRLPEIRVSACHGFGTFTRLEEDVLDPPFADLVRSRRGSGWYVDLLACQQALDQTVDALVEARVAA